MTSKVFDRLLLFALFFFAYWFFGNLYEEIVLVPNQLVDSYHALVCWQTYFKVTNQIYYYVPFTPLAVVAACVLYFYAQHEQQKKFLKKAGIFGVLAIIITVLIVTQLNLKLFFGDLDEHKNELFTMSVIWLFANAVRLYLVGNSLYYAFQTYVLRKQLK